MYISVGDDITWLVNISYNTNSSLTAALEEV